MCITYLRLQSCILWLEHKWEEEEQNIQGCMPKHSELCWQWDKGLWTVVVYFGDRLNKNDFLTQVLFSEKKILLQCLSQKSR